MYLYQNVKSRINDYDFIRALDIRARFTAEIWQGSCLCTSLGGGQHSKAKSNCSGAPTNEGLLTNTRSIRLSTLNVNRFVIYIGFIQDLAGSPKSISYGKSNTNYTLCFVSAKVFARDTSMIRQVLSSVITAQ